MTIIEINTQRVKQQKTFNDRSKAYAIYLAAYKSMADLDLQEQLVHDELVKRIKKHFKGVQVDIQINDSRLLIGYDSTPFLDYEYGSMVFQGISKKLAYKIIAEYEEVYGEIEEISFCPVNHQGLSGPIRTDLIARINRIGKEIK